MVCVIIVRTVSYVLIVCFVRTVRRRVVCRKMGQWIVKSAVIVKNAILVLKSVRNVSFHVFRVMYVANATIQNVH